MKFVLPFLALLLGACVSTPSLITGTPTGIPITNPTLVNDLQSAAYNLDQAVTVGALDANDPAPKCLHDVLVKAGIEVPAGTAPPASFVPKNDGLVSAGATAYILAQQARKIAANGVPVSVDCEALVGRVVIDGAKTVNKVLIPSLLK